jgi:hypothetical protein
MVANTRGGKRIMFKAIKGDSLLFIVAIIGCLALLPVSVAHAGCGSCGAHAEKTEVKAGGTCGSTCGHAKKTEAKAAEGCCGTCGHAHGSEAKATKAGWSCAGDAGAKQAGAEAAHKTAVVEAVEQYIKQDKQARGGYFLLYDAKHDKPLALTLKGVHADKVMHAGDGKFLACADFVDTSGKTYDVDIFVKQAADSQLEVSEVAIHKAGDEHRYKWHKTEHGLEKQHADHGGSEAKRTAEKS